MIPFSVHVEGDPEGQVTLVLGVSHPYLLVGPGPGESSPRWVRPEDVVFSQVYFDSPWHAPFSYARRSTETDDSDAARR